MEICSYCDRKNWDSGVQRKTSHMDFGLFKQLVDEVATMEPVPAITVSYEGESTLNPNFVRMLEYLKKKRVRPWITIRPEYSHKQELKAIIENCSAVSVSMELLDTSCGAKIIDQLLELKSSKNSNLEISVNHTLCPPYELVSPLVIKFVNRFIEKVHEIYLWKKIEYGASITHSDTNGIVDHLKRRKVCKQPFSFFAILSDGRVSPCCNTSRVLLKTIDASMGIKAVLSSPEYGKFLEDHENITLKQYICKKCTLWIDEWLGDEKIMLSLSEGKMVEVFLEGNTFRIKGSLRKRDKQEKGK